MTIPEFPLHWPAHMARAVKREKGAFKTTFAKAIDNVKTSLSLFGRDTGKQVTNFVATSNATLFTRSPEDPGVAIWFSWDGMQLCIPIDRYTTIEANLQAIHHIIEADRVKIRHGSVAIVRASYTGFQALPAPAGTHWSEVLGVSRNARIVDITNAYRAKARTAHPDHGGSQEDMSRLNEAYEAAKNEVRPNG